MIALMFATTNNIDFTLSFPASIIQQQPRCIRLANGFITTTVRFITEIADSRPRGAGVAIALAAEIPGVPSFLRILWDGCDVSGVWGEGLLAEAFFG